MIQGNSFHFRLIREGFVSKKNKGLWLKAEIMFNNKLTLIEKIIVSVIAGYQKGNKDCFVSDSYLAMLCSCNRVTISRNIKTLLLKGVVHKRYKKVQDEMKRVLWIEC